MKNGTKRRMEWEDTRETICVWKRVERKVEIGKIESMETMVRKYGKRKWENFNKIGTLENMKLENIRKIGSIWNMNLEYIKKIRSMEIWKVGNG